MEMRRMLVVVAVMVLASCGAGRRGDSACAGAGFVGGAEVADGMFAARIPDGCATEARRTCTIADGHGPIARETVPPGIAQSCFVFNQFVGSGLTAIPGYDAGECFARALLTVAPPAVGVPREERPTFRCDGGRAPRANAGTRVPIAGVVASSKRIAGRAADPWPHPPEAGSVGETRLARPPPWALLTWRTTDGRRCYEPGQYVDRHTPGRSDELPGVRSRGQLRRSPMVGTLRYDSRSGIGVQLYGIGRFAEYDPSVGGSCGRRPPMISWESRFARRDLSFAVTVISGLVGAGPVAVRVEGRWKRVPVRDGAFIAVVRGVRASSELPVRLRTRTLR
jgi:hypothetical protein